MKFKNWDCDIQNSFYGNGQPAIILNDSENGEKIATATSCLDLNAELPKGHTLIKDYSENEGMLKALTDQGIVEDTGKIHPSGFVHLHEVKIVGFSKEVK